MALPLSIFESCDILQPVEVSPFDALLLQARVAFYEYIEANARAQWQVVEHVEQDLAQIAIQHEPRSPESRCVLNVDPVQNDLNARTVYAATRYTQDPQDSNASETRPPTRSSSMPTPLGFYIDGKRYSTVNPPQTYVKNPAAEGLQAGWLAEKYLGAFEKTEDHVADSTEAESNVDGARLSPVRRHSSTF